MSKPRVLLIGWDAADWKVIKPLLAAGEMPNLARLIAGGLHGNIATLYPVLSPMLWTSIATGKRAFKHGIHGFSEPLPDGSGVRPISSLSRQTKAIWNILNQNGKRSLVVGWWPSHPAEPINGVMVSNHFEQPVGTPEQMPPLPMGTIHPPALAASLAELRVNPMELNGDFLRLFAPDFAQVNQAEDKRLHSLGKIIAETMSVHAVATELLETQEWDFAGIYYSGLDHFGHAFMRYHPPRLPQVAEADFEIFHPIIANAYRYHDVMLGQLLAFADENTTVILMSDHGFHPDAQRVEYIPAEPAGPAIEHRHFGILCLKGPGLRANEPIFGASLLDVCPTILNIFGLPPGQDMDGKVLLTAFKNPTPLEPIESWDLFPGAAGTHPTETRLDPVASAEAFKQLVELGYVAPPGPNVKDTVDECVRELKYNLARSYRDGNHCGEAADLAEEIWERWPKEHRFGLLLIDCLLPLGQVQRRGAAIKKLAQRMEQYQVEARGELARRAEAKAQAEPKAKKISEENRREQFEEKQWRELLQGRPLLLDWLFVSQALLEKKPTVARALLPQLMTALPANPGLAQRVAGALTELGDFAAARNLLEPILVDDPENAGVHSQLADIHFQAKRFDETIAAAAESLSLLYFQPGLHALLGRALMEKQMFSEAEQELRVAVAQSPRNLVAHEALARLYRRHLHRPEEAFAHEGRAQSLKHELAARNIANPAIPDGSSVPEARTVSGWLSRLTGAPEPAAFANVVDPQQIITVVSGLPRSGTSLMMQLLAAGGRVALTDGRRIADEDNPLGYYEFEKTLELARDVSWIPQARGKVIKVVAQLLPYLPRNEYYHIVFMERNLGEVIASQKAMLERQGRQGANLAETKLAETYVAQLNRLQNLVANRSEMRLLAVSYGALLANPPAEAARLANFLGEPFQVAAAGRRSDPNCGARNSDRVGLSTQFDGAKTGGFLAVQGCLPAAISTHPLPAGVSSPKMKPAGIMRATRLNRPPTARSNASFSEAGAWRDVGAGWQPLFGSFRGSGFSIEWHDFFAQRELDWAASFHPGCVELCLNLEGDGFVSGKGGRLELAPNSAGFYRREEEALVAQRAANQQHRFLTAEFSPSFLAKHLGAATGMLHPVVRAAVADAPGESNVGAGVRLSTAQQQLIATLRQPPVYAAAQPIWYQCKAVELALMFFVQPPADAELFCTRQNRVAQERVEQVMALLKQNVAKPPPLEELGKKIGCSHFYLSRIFSAQTGQTITQFLRQIRMEKAAELLRSGEYNVTEVAMEVGYNSLSHFSAAFHETFGCCPGLYPVKTPAQSSR